MNWFTATELKLAEWVPEVWLRPPALEEPKLTPEVTPEAIDATML